MEQNIKIITSKNKISIKKLKELSGRWIESLVKATIDTIQELMVIGGQFHADQETLLLSKGSRKETFGMSISILIEIIKSG